MSKLIDLTGQRFGDLVVLERDINKPKGRAYWICQCDCGKIISTLGTHLRQGNSKSCGCKRNFKDLTGQKFGKLIVMELSKNRDKDNCHKWICKCECGAIKEISQHDLRRGVSSCGCVRSKGEERISQLLTEMNILFKREYYINGFKLTTGGVPHFDFALFNDKNDLICFIEYHGEQHYQARGNIFTEEKVQIIKKRDKEKEEYCILNNVPLKIIPYTDFKQLNCEYLMRILADVI